MTEDHERIEELIAGYALLALEGDDAAEADAILADHVPTCLRCRQILAQFRGVTGDLALLAEPALPPDLLLPRIHRAMQDVPLAGRSRRGAYYALAASVAALVAMGGLSFTMADRANKAEVRTQTALEAFAAMRSPDVTPVSLTPQGQTPAGNFLEVAPNDVRRLYLITSDCPEPSPGMVFVVWLGSGGTYVPYETFRPDDHGHVVLRVDVDVSRYDEIWITEEVTGSRPAVPNESGRYSWRAPLA